MATNSNWTDEQKQQVIDEYLAADPTADTTMEIVKEIAENVEKTVNGTRAVLVAAGEYIKKTPTSSAKSGTNNSDKPKRVSKQDSIDALEAALEAQAIEVDTSITSKLTGKACVYLTSVVAQLVGNEEED